MIAFGGRALEKDVPAKYLNSPETPLFHKGGTLYNIATARAAAHKGAPLIAVEGYVDVIAMVRAGFEATVAPLGTALTADQLALLWKMADEPILLLRRRQAPAAGPPIGRWIWRCRCLQAGQEPASSRSLPEGRTRTIWCAPAAARRVADVLGARRGRSPQMLWMRETEAGGFDTPERRAALEARVGEVTAVITDDLGAEILSSQRLRRPLAADVQGGKRNAPGPKATGTVTSRGGDRWGAARKRARQAARGRAGPDGWFL